MRRKVKSRKSKVKSFAFWLFTFAFLFVFCCSSAWAQRSLGSERLFSPSVGQGFHEIAYELANADDITNSEVEQAIIFSTAAVNLAGRAAFQTQKSAFSGSANYIVPDMIKLASRHSERDYSELMYQLLVSYVDESADLELVREALSYLLERLNSREEREKLLEELLRNLGPKNKVLSSELATLLGLLKAEKADIGSAQAYFMQAYNDNKYNRLAFAKLAELIPEQIGPAMYLEHLRLALGENPLDMAAAVAFGEYAEGLQLYETAAGAYEYCADLFGYIYPAEALPAYIYLPWAISSYNTQRNQSRCLQIASQLRQSGRFDLFLEAIAGKAAAKIGNTERASRILKAAEEKALQLLDDSSSQQASLEQMGWFYCFVLSDADKALDKANKAYSLDPNSPTAAAILAYSLIMSGQTDPNWVGALIDSDNYERNQIADLAMAQIQQHQGQRSLAIKTLKSAIARDPGSLVAERAKEILAQLGGDYIPPMDPDIVLAVLKDSFGQAVVPTFVNPEKIISVQLNVRGSKFSYGSNFGGTIAITNNSSEPLVVSDSGLFAGNIRIDANITGDLDKKIPNLVSIKIQPTSPVEPGASILIPVRLVTAELRQMLLAYPQASLDIEFTVFIDPVATGDGRIVNRLRYVEPARLLVKRAGVGLTGRYLRNRLGSLTKGKRGQKIKTAQLFTGLLSEQHAMANREPLYKFMYADWMPDLLKSALAHNLADDDWTVRVHTMAGMLSLPLDYELVSAVAENLDDTHWPVRLMAVYLLAKAQGDNFRKVLDWTAKYDSSELVRDMAIALGASVRE